MNTPLTTQLTQYFPGSDSIQRPQNNRAYMKLMYTYIRSVITFQFTISFLWTEFNTFFSLVLIFTVHVYEVQPIRK